MPDHRRAPLVITALLLGASALSVAVAALGGDGGVGDDLRLFVASAASDPPAGWLDVVDAQGVARDASVQDVQALVRVQRLDAGLDLSTLRVALRSGAPMNITKLDGVRDRDGSLEHHVANEGDMLRMHLRLPQPASAGTVVGLVLAADGVAHVDVGLVVPRPLYDGFVSLDVRHNW